jgi:uncharacterized protein YcaQ
MALRAQGLGVRRPARSRADHVLGAVGKVGALQLDAINVVERTQFLTLFARIGAYNSSAFRQLTGPLGRLYETPGVLAELVLMDRQPLFRPEVPRGRSIGTPRRSQLLASYLDANRTYINSVLKQVADDGPLTAAQLADPRRRGGEWWDRRSDGRRALEYLFRRGDLSAWRSEAFERVYDLTERVVPPEVLALPTPAVDEAHRQLLLLAADALGVATAGDLAEYHLVKPPRAAPRLRELVEAGALVPVAVEGWREAGYMRPGAQARSVDPAQVRLLPPFDPIRRGHRSRLNRVFGFDHRIEVYVPAPKRRFGYYVFPVLHGDQLAARVDLKADRQRSTLLVLGAWSEPGQVIPDHAPALGQELHNLRDWLKLSHVQVIPNGDLARALQL